MCRSQVNSFTFPSVFCFSLRKRKKTLAELGFILFDCLIQTEHPYSIDMRPSCRSLAQTLNMMHCLSIKMIRGSETLKTPRRSLPKLHGIQNFSKTPRCFQNPAGSCRPPRGFQNPAGFSRPLRKPRPDELPLSVFG